jgi:hypothetical protein
MSTTINEKMDVFEATKGSRSFVEFLPKVPKDAPITLYNLQGVVWMPFGRSIRAQYLFEREIAMACEMRVLERISDNEYRRIGPDDPGAEIYADLAERIKTALLAVNDDASDEKADKGGA